MDNTLLLGLLTVFIAGINRGFTGFGSGLVMVPILSMVYSPVFAVICAALLELVPSLQLMPKAIRHCQWRSVLPMSVVALLTVPAGVALLIYADEGLMRLLIAAMLLLTTLVLARPRQATPSVQGERFMVTTGGISGLLSGATGLGGVPVFLFYLANRFSATDTRSSMVVFLGISSLVSLLSFLSQGMVTDEVLQFSLLVIPVFVIAIWIGGRLFHFASEDLFRKFSLGLLACISLTMILETLLG